SFSSVQKTNKIIEGIAPLGSSERRSAFFSDSINIEDFDLSKTVLNFFCDSFGLLESTLCINPVLHQFIFVFSTQN
ncbi:hypothetical protein BpHYR1_003656, partial [Brachionus plicatilis]